MNPQIKEQTEKTPKTSNGFTVLILNTLFEIASIVLMVIGIISISLREQDMTGIFPSDAIDVTAIIVGAVLSCIVCPIIYAGLHIIKPNEAKILTFFGKYVGTLKNDGYYFVNPFCSAMSFPTGNAVKQESGENLSGQAVIAGLNAITQTTKKMSLKTMTLNNEKQKINDAIGNPIVIGIVVIWRVANTAKAAFNVDNYKEFLSTQCDSALRNIVRLYPYDLPDEENEKSLRSSSKEIAEALKSEIQEKTEAAGLEIIEARITHLSYAPEIAAAMLQRQQASAVVDARKLIVDGAVGMVEMALSQLSEKEIINLDEERKAQMVSNLLVVLCGNKDPQPIVNSGTLY